MSLTYITHRKLNHRRRRITRKELLGWAVGWRFISHFNLFADEETPWLQVTVDSITPYRRSSLGVSLYDFKVVVLTHVLLDNIRYILYKRSPLLLISQLR
jgi:hypothetical protein